MFRKTIQIEREARFKVNRSPLLIISLCCCAVISSLLWSKSYAAQDMTKLGVSISSGSANNLSSEQNDDAKSMDSFNECLGKFFGPGFANEVNNAGQKFSSSAVYSWFAIVIPNLASWAQGGYNLAIETNRKYFTDKGWGDYQKYVEAIRVKEFFSENDNHASITSFLQTAPLFNWDKQDNVSRASFRPILRSSYRYPGHGKETKYLEKRSKLLIRAIRNSSDGKFLIDGWELQGPVEEIR